MPPFFPGPCLSPIYREATKPARAAFSPRVRFRPLPWHYHQL